MADSCGSGVRLGQPGEVRVGEAGSSRFGKAGRDERARLAGLAGQGGRALLAGLTPTRLLALIVSVLVAVIALLPLVEVMQNLHGLHWGQLWADLSRPRSRGLLLNTVELTALVTVGAGVLGTACALVLNRVWLPFPAVFNVLLLLPMAMPDFVVSYAWHSLWPRLGGLLAASAIMTVSVYPLVYLPVAAALRRRNRALEDCALLLGKGRLSVLLRVTLPLVAPAIAGGAVIVALTVLSEYGAFEVLRFHTFTTNIVAAFKFDRPLAFALCLPLLALTALVLLLGARAPITLGGASSFPEANSSESANTSGFPTAGADKTSGDKASEKIKNENPATSEVKTLASASGKNGENQEYPGVLTVLAGLGQAGLRPSWGSVPAGIFVLAICAVGVGVPVGALIYWMVVSTHTTLPARVTIWQAAWTTASLSIVPALVAVAVIMPLGYLAVRTKKLSARLCEQAIFVTRGIPGVIVALGVLGLILDYVYDFYQTDVMLMTGYALLGLPLALVCVKASIAQLNPRLEEVGLIAGVGRARVWTRISLPLLAPGLGAAVAMVFLTTATELTATLLLAPPDTVTLATQFWAFQREGAYGAAAPYALGLIVMAAAPAALLGMWFDKPRGRSGRPVTKAVPEVSTATAEKRIEQSK